MNVAHTCYGSISKERLAYIAQFTSADIMVEKFRNPNTWLDLRHIILYHPNAIIRHEAFFVIGEARIYDVAPFLMQVVKFDRSIVAKHEALEALGVLAEHGYAKKKVYRFLERIIHAHQEDAEIGHPDVQATASLALEKLRNKKGNSHKE